MNRRRKFPAATRLPTESPLCEGYSAAARAGPAYDAPKFYIFDDQLPVDENKWKIFCKTYIEWQHALGMFESHPGESDFRKREQIHLRAMLAFSELEISESDYRKVCESPKYQKVIEVYHRETDGTPLMSLNATGEQYDEGQRFTYYSDLIELFLAPMEARIACTKNFLVTMRQSKRLTASPDEQVPDDLIERLLELVDADFKELEQEGRPTVAIEDENKQGDYIVINTSDFDVTKHNLWLGPLNWGRKQRNL